MKDKLSGQLTGAARELLTSTIASLQDPEQSLDRRVHRVRTTGKKMRAWLRLLGSQAGVTLERELDRFREAGKRLAPMREAWVQDRLLAEVSGSAESGLPDLAGDAPTLEALAECRADLQDALQWLDRWSCPVGRIEDLAPGLEDTYGKALQAWEYVREAPADEHFHALRKWVKYHYYQLGMLQRPDSRKLGRRLKRLDALGDLLGRAHDLADLQNHPRVLADPALAERVEALKQARYAEAAKIAGQVLSLRVAELRRQVRHLWKHGA